MQGEFDPTIVAGPICIAGLAVLAYRLLERDSAARQHLLDDLRDAQADPADAQHHAGVLAERTRLSREIHDSVAQGLTSINLLLQAAEREWSTRPTYAHDHLGQVACTARSSLDEVRRVVRDLAPVDLTDGDPTALAAALRRAGEEAAVGTDTTVTVHVHGAPRATPADVSTALVQRPRRTRQHHRARCRDEASISLRTNLIPCRSTSATTASVATRTPSPPTSAVVAASPESRTGRNISVANSPSSRDLTKAPLSPCRFHSHHDEKRQNSNHSGRHR